jgi:hypothetical protein
MSNAAVIKVVEEGYRMEMPENCPEEVCELMRWSWAAEASARPSFEVLAQRLEAVAGECSEGTMMAECNYVQTISIDYNN